MPLTATIIRSVEADIQAELRHVERAVIIGTREAGRGLKAELRRQVASAGLGQRLANSWRDSTTRPATRRREPGYTKAPQIIRAFNEAAVIRSTRKHFLPRAPSPPTETPLMPGGTARCLRCSPPADRGGPRSRPDPRRPRLRPDLRPARTRGRGDLRRTGDQERYAFLEGRLRGRNTPRRRCWPTAALRGVVDRACLLRVLASGHTSAC